MFRCQKRSTNQKTYWQKSWSFQRFSHIGPSSVFTSFKFTFKGEVETFTCRRTNLATLSSELFFSFWANFFILLTFELTIWFDFLSRVKQEIYLTQIGQTNNHCVVSFQQQRLKKTTMVNQGNKLISIWSYRRLVDSYSYSIFDSLLAKLPLFCFSHFSQIHVIFFFCRFF